MNITDDLHQQFAEFFEEEAIWPYAYLLSQRLTEGNICIPVGDVRTNLESTPYGSAIAPTDLIKYPKLITKDNVNAAPFVMHNDRLYFQRYFKYETSIIESLQV